MRIDIENFAKIQNASVIIDGITIIAGNNNTGKSTVGKVLFSTYNSLYDIADQVENYRRESLSNICERYLRNFLIHSSTYGYLKDNKKRISTVILSDEISEELINELVRNNYNSLNKEMLESYLESSCNKYGISLKKEGAKNFIEDIYNDILDTINTDNYRIALYLIESFFNRVFDGQIQNLKFHGKAKISLSIKNKKIDLIFEDGECVSWKSETDIMHQAFLIDNPFVIDTLNTRRSYFYSAMAADRFLSKKIEEASINDEKVFEKILAKGKLKEIYKLLNEVVPGDINKDTTSREWSLQSLFFNEPITFGNLSAGLKSFVLLRILLEKGILREKDVLILDEPEIHLHPEWQIKYAEIIVLLQKEFDLSIVVTTHSQEFLEAIELFSKKHEIIDKCRYYLAMNNEGSSEFKDVTDDLTTIYRQLITPGRYLDKIRFELEEKDELL